MEATLGRTTWASRLPRRHGRRAQAPRDGWWLAPTCRKHAATSPDRPRPDLRAGLRTKMCSARRQAGRLALGRNGQARPLSPVPIGTYMTCMSTMWGVRGGQGRSGGVAATLRGSGEHARWPSGWVPEDARPEVFPIVPSTPHTLSARTICMCTRRARKIRVPWG